MKKIARVISFLIFLLIFFSLCVSLSINIFPKYAVWRTEEVKEMKYLSYWRGYKIITTSGKILYRPAGWISGMNMKEGREITYAEKR